MHLIIETKKEGEQFEDTYDNNTLHLRAVKHVEGDTYDFKNLDALPWQLFKVNKEKQTVADIDAMLSEMYGIPVDKLVVLLRHENLLSNTNVRTELYNIDWRKSMIVDKASKLDHGTILYVEEGNLKANLNEHQWTQQFTKDQDRITLMVNDPYDDPDGLTFQVKLELRRDNTLLEFKQRIADTFGLSTSEFVLKKYMMQREFKNMGAKLAELGLTNGNLVKIERGTPHQDGVYEINIHQVTLHQDCKEDSHIFDKKFLFKVQIAPDASAIEFKHKILNQYNSTVSTPLTIDQV